MLQGDRSSLGQIVKADVYGKIRPVCVTGIWVMEPISTSAIATAVTAILKVCIDPEAVGGAIAGGVIGNTAHAGTMNVLQAGLKGLVSGDGEGDRWLNYDLERAVERSLLTYRRRQLK